MDLTKIWNFIVKAWHAIAHYFTGDGSDGKLFARGELIVSLIVMLVIAILAIIIGAAVKKADPSKPPKGLTFIGETIVGLAENQITDILGTAYLRFTPYLVFIIIYVPLAFISGLFGLPSPMTYYTIPLCLAFVSWFGIQASAIHYQKFDYVKGFSSPLPAWMPIMAPINLLSKMAPLLSLSIRMFGNALAGTILMWLVYWGTGMASNAIFGMSNFNIIGIIVAPWLHAYFDAFGAFVQTLIFMTLTMLLIATEIPAPVNIDPEKEKQKQLKKQAKKAKKAN